MLQISIKKQEDLHISKIYSNFAAQNCLRMAKIGVFDSGYGGLTILEAIRKELPQYDYLYLGDNARAPYGTHSFDVIYRYTLEAVKYLFAHDCALVILACNTASAKALRTIQQRDLPEINHQLQITNHQSRRVNVLGVIRPTVEAVPALTMTRHIGILGTPATVSSESYVMELEKIDSSLVITQQSCPLWVPLIENNEHNTPGAKFFIEKYLDELLAKDHLIDTIVLGCTHYPLIKKQIDRYLGDKITTIAQGELEAKSLADYLSRHPEYRSQLSLNGTCHYLTTENADRFSQSASHFLHSPIMANHIDL